MTTPPPISENPDRDGELSRWDEIAGRLLDENSSDVLETESLSPAECRRVADLQLLDSLLRHVYQPIEAERDRRVRGAMAAVARESQLVPADVESGAARRIVPPRRRRLWSVPLISAVVVVLAAALFLQVQEGPQSAVAAVDRALDQAQVDTDREYTVTTAVRGPVLGEQETTSTLYVKGASRFAVRQPTPLGELWLGGNDEEVWVVPQVGPVLVGSDELLWRVSREQQLSTPFLQVSSLLTRLKDRYELELLADEELPLPGESNGTILCQHIRGRALSDEALQPQTIEVWIARQSGIVHRAVLLWDRPAPQPGLLRVESRLTGEPDLPEDWYTHEAHHGPRRVVLRRPQAPASEPAANPEAK